ASGTLSTSPRPEGARTVMTGTGDVGPADGAHGERRAARSAGVRDRDVRPGNRAVEWRDRAGRRGGRTDQRGPVDREVEGPVVGAGERATVGHRSAALRADEGPGDRIR